MEKDNLMNSLASIQPRRIPEYLSPYGARLTDGGVLFSFVSRNATGARLLLYDAPEDEEPSLVIPLDDRTDRLGYVWRIFVPGAGPGTLYHFQVDGPFDPVNGHRFDGRARLVDPYADALAGDFLPQKNGVCLPPKCVVVDHSFDWENEPHITRSLADEVIYELHVRGFTNSPTSAVAKPGTYLGLIEKIPYLKSLGVTAVELMPVHEFPRNDPDGTTPKRKNYWGYDPIAFFAPHRGYAWSDEPGAQVREFKEMVRELHKAGIEVFLDVVFNHTAEGNERGETFSFKGLENKNYYLLLNQGRYANYTGCGNTVNGNHPWMRDLIFSCLRSWAGNYHIDGFRFDLASILSRNRDGKLVSNPPVLEMIAEDPLLSHVKIIAEAWDAAGAYQVGSFGNARWAEWNGRFRDDVRRFWRGDDWSIGAFATRLAGSSDLYQAQGRTPSCSVNFITAHDGFTLNDLVSYNHKHNYANGEENRDGENNNISYNFGFEGETSDEKVKCLRARQIRNMFCSLLLSQGVPMIVAGDEVRRTQKGNNNAYCQDSPISWFDWLRAEKNDDLRRFVASLIRLRREEASLRRRNFFSGRPQAPGDVPDISWFGATGGAVDWNSNEQSSLVGLISVLDPRKDPFFAEEIAKAGSLITDVSPFNPALEASPEAKFDILFMVNPKPYDQTFFFPAVSKLPIFLWRSFVDTAAAAPYDVYPSYDGPIPDVEQPLELPGRSTRIFLSCRNAQRIDQKQ